MSKEFNGPYRFICAVLALSLGSCLSGATAATPNEGERAPAVQVWLSTADKHKLLSSEPAIAFNSAADAANVADTVIEVNPAKRYQKVVGFGAAITDSSAWLIEHKLNPANRDALMQELFGPAPGIGLSFTRLSIGASDFSLNHYSLDDMPPGQSDPELKHFSIEENREYLLPVVKQALALNPKLSIMASPWSAPAWMKSTDSMVKGSLKPEAYAAFAEYLRRYVTAYKAEGVPIFALTLQNEPHYEPKNYPGMRMDSAARATFIGKYLGPLLAKREPQTQILEWDHNWDEPTSPAEVLADPRAAKYVKGVAWHCYGGDPQMQTVVHDAHPSKDVYLTECSPLRRAWFVMCAANGGACPKGLEAVAGADNLAYFVRVEIIEPTRNWARGLLLWNLALDENHGPRSGGCDVCRGLVTIDSQSGEVSRGVEYYTMAHVSRFVRPGAVRIASSSVKDRIETVAFRNSDDASVVLLAVNPTRQLRRFTVNANGRSFDYSLEGGGVVTLVWK
ncbi:MAG: glycosyl hydrolase [Paucibacter sp.]|nr:glycosyl hydrolase [Roseateles sp.]